MNPTFRLLILGSALVLRGGPAFAAEPVNPLPAFKAEIQKAQAAVRSSLDAVVATIDAEQKAERLKPEHAEREKRKVQELRDQIESPVGGERLTGAQVSIDAKAGDASAAALNKVWGDFSEALRAAEAARGRAQAAFREDAARYALAVWRSAKTEAELAPALAALEVAAEHEGEVMSRGRARGMPAAVLQSFIARSQQFLAALAAGDVPALSSALASMRQLLRPGEASIFTPADLEQWRQRFAGAAREQLRELVRVNLEGLITARAPSGEVLALAEKVDRALAVERAIAGARLDGMDASSHAAGQRKGEANFARPWGEMLNAVEAGDWGTAQSVAKAMQPPAQSLSPAALAVVTAKRAEVKQGADAAEQTARAAGEKRARELLAKVTDAESALALADLLKAERETAPASPQTAEFPAFEADLRQLAAAWSSDPAQPRAAFAQWTTKVNARGWTTDLRALRMRAFREHIAQRVQAPELAQPPLNALPPEQAVRQFGRGLLEKADWPRLHRLLTDTAMLFGQGHGAPSEEAQAIRSFITAENFEKAEQFAEAVQAYRSVLTCIGDLVPIAQAATRLKELKKAHPDLFKEARPINPAANEAF